jgi:ABC-2 type transport system permease protein
MTYFRLLYIYLRVSVMSELQYRVNFFVQLVQSLIALVTGLIVLTLVFSYTNELSGWSRPELLAVMGVHILVGGLIKLGIQPNMERLMGDVQQGTLDYTLTKPEDSQLLISVRETRIWQIVDVVLGAIVLGTAVVQLDERVGWQQALGFILALFLGALMIYSFWLILTTSSFWFVRVDNILELFQSMYQAGRWPVGIYPDALRLSLTFLVPIAFAVTIPAEALTGRLTWQTLAGAAVLALVLLVLARVIFRIGLRNYTGASA